MPSNSSALTKRKRKRVCSAFFKKRSRCRCSIKPAPTSSLLGLCPECGRPRPQHASTYLGLSIFHNSRGLRTCCGRERPHSGPSKGKPAAQTTPRRTRSTAQPSCGIIRAERGDERGGWYRPDKKAALAASAATPHRPSRAAE